MDYQKIYDNLIKTRSQQPLLVNEYYEKHHIIPKCLGGSDDKENLIKLTYREHFIAHWLLVKIHKQHSGINYAFLCMLRRQPTGERILTSRRYEIIKKNFSEFKKWHSKIINPGKSEKSRLAARKRMLERNPIKMDPSKNRTAQPIRIYFSDGRIEEYKYAKEYCLNNNVPYSTIKPLLRKEDTKCKKHGIIRIERI